jgi:O-antigen ligase
MASTFAVTRNHLVFGLCLPLAVLMGYLLAEPLESTSLVVMVMVLSVLAVPIVMRWYHPLLVFSWNAVIQLNFLPGSPKLWVAMSFLALLFAVLNRSVNPESRFINVPSITRPLLVLLAVFLLTGMARGGLGMRVLGSGAYGGKGYLLVVGSIAGYFALTSRAIPLRRAGVYAGMFFLLGLTALVSNLIYMGGSSLYFLYQFFPVELAMDQAVAAESLTPEYNRIGSMVTAGMAAFSFLLLRYGADGIFAFSKPWRMAMFIGTLMASGFAGFRSLMILMSLTFFVMFFVQRLWRTRIVLIVACSVALMAAGIIAFSNKFPIPVQRTLSFLPFIEIDPLTRLSAESTTEWRLELWKAALPLVPQYLFLGKGYVISPDELFMAQQSAEMGNTATWEGAFLAGDFHNGPLSLIVPFGIYGVLAFLWFAVASIRLMNRYYKNGPSELKRINAFLLSLFVARILFFVFIFGSFQSELFYFTGIIGLAVALNESASKVVSSAEGEDIEENDPMR